MSSIGVSVTDEESLTDMVWANSERFADVVSFRKRADHSWLDVTAREFASQVLGVAKGFIANGLRPGDPVTSLCANGYEWAVGEFAIWAAGGTSVPHGCGARTVVDPDELAVLAGRGHDIDDEAAHARRLAVGAADPATADATHGRLLSEVRSTLTRHPRLLGSGGSMLIAVPMSHPFATVAALCAVYSRTPLAIGRASDLGTLRPTVVVAEPRLLREVYDQARRRAHAEDRDRLFDTAESIAVAYGRALDGPGPGMTLRGRHALASRFVYPKVRAALGGRCTTVICTGEPAEESLRHFFLGVGIAVHSV